MSELWSEDENSCLDNKNEKENDFPENGQYDFWSEQVKIQQGNNMDNGYEPNFIIAETVSDEEQSEPTVVVEKKNNIEQDLKEGQQIYMIQNQREDDTGFFSERKHKKKKNRPVLWWVKLVAGAAIFGLVAGFAFQVMTFIEGGAGNKKIANDNLQNNNITKTTIEKTVTNSSDTGKSMPNDVSKVVDSTMPSIVSITSTITTKYNYYGQSFDKDTDGSGSGIIFDQNDNEILIVTNNHVIANAKAIVVTFVDGNTFNAEVKGTDTTSDLAVISIKTENMKKETIALINPIAIGSSDDIKVGQLALAIGNALGYGQSLTVGYISAKDREVAVDNNTMKLIQTDAAINPGNSGGALLNKEGELIGINSLKYADTDVEGMGYAIPITVATPIINELAKREVLKESEKGYLGISGTDVTETISQNYNMPEGIYVSEVSDDSGAKVAGLVKGDIIIKLNGSKVKTISALKERVNAYRVGTKITLTIKRSEDGVYKEKELNVTLKGQKTIESLDEGNSKNNNQNNNNGNDNENNNGNSQPNPYGNNNNGESQDIEEFFNDYFGY